MNRLTKAFALLLAIVVMVLVQGRFPVRADEMAVRSSNGDKVSLLGDIKIDKAASGNVVVILGDIDIEGSIDGDVVSILGNVYINGRVSGEVATILGKARLGDKAEIDKDLVVIGTLEKDGSARIHGQEVRINTGILALVRIFTAILLAFITLIIGLITIVILKDRFTNISFGIEQRLDRKIIIGILGFLGLSILSLLLFFTIIFPIAFFGIVLLAEIASSIFFGKLLSKLLKLSLNVYMQFVTGLLIITLARVGLTLMIAGIGFIVSLVLYGLFSAFVCSLGIGILIDTKLGTVCCKAAD